MGRATAREFVLQGFETVCFLRRGADSSLSDISVDIRIGDVSDWASMLRDEGDRAPFEAVISCLASRSGTPQDAWAIDYHAQSAALRAGQAAGVQHFVLLSAICVQTPELAFQKAKLAFEAELIASGLTYSIVRPTAFFKSLSGQIDRVRDGKSFLVFGTGADTACKPISRSDLARYIVGCLNDPTRQNRILPIGGPGPAVTPLDQAKMLFDLTGQPLRIRRIPVGLLNAIVGLLTAAGRVVPTLAEKAELARIARFYATQSMLVYDPIAGRYDAEATPSFGSETLFDYYERVLNGQTEIELVDRTMF